MIGPVMNVQVDGETTLRALMESGAQEGVPRVVGQ
jgi:hypothetical protein